MPIDEHEARPDTVPRVKADHAPPVIQGEAVSLDAPEAAREPETSPAAHASEASTPESPPPRKKKTALLACIGIGAAGLAALAGYSWLPAAIAPGDQNDAKQETAAPQVRNDATDKRASEASTAPAAAAPSNPAQSRVAQGDAAPAGAAQSSAAPNIVSPSSVSQNIPAQVGAVSEQRKPPEAVPAEALAALDNRIAAAEAATRSTGEALARLTQIDRRIAALETAPKVAPDIAPAPVDLSPVENRIAALEKKLGAVEAALAAPKNDTRVTEAAIAPATRESDGASLAAVAQAIRGALERGDGFATELAVAKALGADTQLLANLEPVAGNGAATARKLAQAFRPLSRAIIEAAAPPKQESASVLDQISNAATKLVRVRPAGEAAGEDAAALVSQIDGALNRGEISGALAVWNRIPAAARKTSEAWAEEAKRRVAADIATQSIFNAAIADIGRKRSAQ